jgi:hypothetical protein
MESKAIERRRQITTSKFVNELSCDACGFEKATVKVGEKRLCKGCYSELNRFNEIWVKAMINCDFDTLRKIVR